MNHASPPEKKSLPLWILFYGDCVVKTIRNQGNMYLVINAKQKNKGSRGGEVGVKDSILNNGGQEMASGEVFKQRPELCGY